MSLSLSKFQLYALVALALFTIIVVGLLVVTSVMHIGLWDVFPGTSLKFPNP